VVQGPGPGTVSEPKPESGPKADVTAQQPKNINYAKERTCQVSDEQQSTWNG